MSRYASHYLESIPEVEVAFLLPHPGDAELLCGGSILKLTQAGRRVAVLDLTDGGAGSSASADLRLEQADRGAEVLGLTWRGCVMMPDARMENTIMSRMTVTGEIKRLRPKVVVASHWEHPHPDAASSSRLVEDACYLAGLERLDNYLAAHRSVRVVFACGDTQVQPTFVVDITEHFEGKLEAVRQHKALFGDEKEFLAGVEARARYFGALIGVKFGEPFVERGPREGALL